MEKSTTAFLDDLAETEKEILEKSAHGEIAVEEAHAALEHIQSLRKDAAVPGLK